MIEENLEDDLPIHYTEINLYGETRHEIEKNLLEVNKSRFRAFVESMMFEQKMNIFEAIAEYCSEHEVEAEDIQHLIDPSTKSKMEEYAIINHLLKRDKSKTQLPI